MAKTTLPKRPSNQYQKSFYCLFDFIPSLRTLKRHFSGLRSPFRRSLAPFACLGPISVAAASIGLVWGADLQARRGIVVVGRIQPGLPPLTVSWWFHIEKPVGMASSAASICFVGLLEAMSIAKALAEKHGDRVDAAIELRGMPRLPLPSPLSVREWSCARVGNSVPNERHAWPSQNLVQSNFIKRYNI
jgi:hypothetical protein